MEQEPGVLGRVRERMSERVNGRGWMDREKKQEGVAEKQKKIFQTVTVSPAPKT